MMFQGCTGCVHGIPALRTVVVAPSKAKPACISLYLLQSHLSSRVGCARLQRKEGKDTNLLLVCRLLVLQRRLAGCVFLVFEGVSWVQDGRDGDGGVCKWNDSEWRRVATKSGDSEVSIRHYLPNAPVPKWEVGCALVFDEPAGLAGMWVILKCRKYGRVFFLAV